MVLLCENNLESKLRKQTTVLERRSRGGVGSTGVVALPLVLLHFDLLLTLVWALESELQRLLYLAKTRLED